VRKKRYVFYAALLTQACLPLSVCHGISVRVLPFFAFLRSSFAYPDIDIGASQTDSALMRGTARAPLGRADADVFVRLPHAKISGPQGGVKHLLFGCERPKNEFFM
jgi:hypothetical protein